LSTEFRGRIAAARIDLRLNAAPGVAELGGFDRVIVATGVTPRDPGIPADEGAPVLRCDAVLTRAPVGARLAARL
jgi:2,4-dienoyl-CoA reductase (NADPH2)